MERFFPYDKNVYQTGDYNFTISLPGTDQSALVKMVKVIDDVETGRINVVCSNATRIKIDEKINCTIDILQNYVFNVTYKNDSSRTNDTLIPNIVDVSSRLNNGKEIFF